MIYIITRHEGAKQWINQQMLAGGCADFFEKSCQSLTHLYSDIALQRDDIVIGTLPVSIIANLNQQGIRYFHLDISIPVELRGKELSYEQLVMLNATLKEYCVSRLF